MITEEVYPAICEKMLVHQKIPVYVQQDNEKPHTVGSDLIVLLEGV